MAELLSVTPQLISKYESEEKFHTGEKLGKLLEILKVTPDELFAEEFKVHERMGNEIIKFLEKEES
ncbi:helix-turn-helix domain-containing protein [Bacillus sp. NPDC077411]|uniref:helix-turn-helix domain-containing protein n=1 Tax=Bacillus sp. NPDC077411 TaxID=3363947 RepID=UPI0037C610C9